jgi:preprotein translocase subunit SecD
VVAVRSPVSTATLTPPGIAGLLTIGMAVDTNVLTERIREEPGNQRSVAVRRWL